MKPQAGFTLIEVVVALVIIGMAGITVVGLMSSIAMRSAESMSQTQSVKIADAYLREVLEKPFNDPNGVPGGESTRATFDDVQDYQNFPVNEVGARDPAGNLIAGLADYQISIAVANVALGTVPAGQSRRVTVTVTSPQQVRTVLVGYKTLHP